MPLRLYRLSAAAPVPDAAAAPWTEISADWDGRKLFRPFRFRLELHSGSGELGAIIARFDVPIPPLSRQPQPAGSFVEGLWNFDVAELFLRGDPAGAYQEFNLSPFGEWWSCGFSSYRCGRTPSPDFVLRAESRHTAGGWSGELTIPLAGLRAKGIDSSAMAAHVSAISGPGAERRYISSNPLAGETPDFHRAETFEVLACVEV